jgi:hypothetical protein
MGWRKRILLVHGSTIFVLAVFTFIVLIIANCGDLKCFISAQTAGDKLIVITTIFTIAGVWLGSLAILEYLGWFDWLKNYNGEIKPVFEATGGRMIYAVEKKWLPTTSYMGFTVKNNGDTPIQKNTLQYVVRIPKEYFEMIRSGIGAREKYYQPEFSDYGDNLEFRGVIPIRIDPQKKREIFRIRTHIMKHTEYNIDYYFYDSNKNKYYPKVKINEFDEPIDNLGKLKVIIKDVNS